MPYKVGDLVVPVKEHYVYFFPRWQKGDPPLKIREVGERMYYFENPTLTGPNSAYFYRVTLYKGELTKEQLIIDKINYLYSISKCPLEKKWITKHD